MRPKKEPRYSAEEVFQKIKKNWPVSKFSGHQLTPGIVKKLLEEEQ